MLLLDCQRGFTLLELLITLVVAGVLLTVAVPSYRGLIQRNTLAASANALIGDLNFARSQAVTRGRTVFICPSADQNDCGGSWSDGWMVYSRTPDNAMDRLRVHASHNEQISFTGNGGTAQQVAFNSNGFADGAGAGTITVAAADAADHTRIVIARSGRIHSETVANTGT